MSAPGETRATLMLVLVTALWGLSFTWAREWQVAAGEGPVGELLSSLTLIGLRMPAALLLLGAFQPRLFRAPKRREQIGGLVLGTILFLGFTLQTWGQAFTTPAMSAFFTSLASAWVPLLGFAVFRDRVAPLTLLGLAVALLGCALLVEGWTLDRGLWLTVLASLVFAVQILALDRLGKSLEPAHLTPTFLAATGALALLGAVALAWSTCGVGVWLSWVAGMLARPDVLAVYLLLTLFCTFLSFHWMNRYQPLVSPSRAALIYLLEPIFAAAFSVGWGHDTLTGALVAGGALILGGNLLVELPRLLPLWRRGRAVSPGA
jgi:drug/metabolite transporter (DMT)-like permease